MGCHTPAMRPIGQDDIASVDSSGLRSCTSGRLVIIAGLNPIRWDFATIGMPGTPHGRQPEGSNHCWVAHAHGLGARQLR
ncbi:protein of unknown function [Cyanobium sp. NIES-981]|nr:protein of unknown function [Cyanobium sp. NIES-981]